MKLEIIKEDTNSVNFKFDSFDLDHDGQNQPNGVFIIGNGIVTSPDTNFLLDFAIKHRNMLDAGDNVFNYFENNKENFEVLVSVDGTPLDKTGSNALSFLRVDLWYNDNKLHDFYLPMGWIDFANWDDALLDKDSYDIEINYDELIKSIEELANKVLSTGEEQAVTNNNVISAVLDKNGNKLKTPAEKKREELQRYVSQKYADITEILDDALDTRSDAVEYRNYDEARKFDEVIDLARELQETIFDYAKNNNIEMLKTKPSFDCRHDSDIQLNKFSFKPENILSGKY